MQYATVQVLHKPAFLDLFSLSQFPVLIQEFNPLNPRLWERLISAPPLEINEGVSGEQDSLNTIFNTHKIRIVCKI